MDTGLVHSEGYMVDAMVSLLQGLTSDFLHMYKV